MLVSKERINDEGIHVVLFPSSTAGTAVRLPTPLLGAFSSVKQIPTTETARLGACGNLVFIRVELTQGLSQMPQNKQIWTQLATLLPDCQKIWIKRITWPNGKELAKIKACFSGGYGTFVVNSKKLECVVFFSGKSTMVLWQSSSKGLWILSRYTCLDRYLLLWVLIN